MTDKKTDENPTLELLKIAIDGWKADFVGSVPYKIMRTFAHHRAGEEYDTDLIFRELSALNKGKHKELVEQIYQFEDTLLKEFKLRVDDKKTNK